MYICLCFGVSDKTIDFILKQHTVTCLKELQIHCQIAQSCGGCVGELKQKICQFALSAHGNAHLCPENKEKVEDSGPYQLIKRV